MPSKSTDTSRSSSRYVLVDGDAQPTWAPTEHPGDDPVEPIAIVGMCMILFHTLMIKACKLPGDVNSPSQLWDMLVNGRSGQCDLPSDRWNIDAFYHPKGGDRPGSMDTKGGYFLKDDIRNFENTFFGINNLEATYMDPQQRKLLEVVFECFESAGVTLEDMSGSNTGCYVGNFTMDFLMMQGRDPEYFHRYTATGMGTTILANRVNHVFNLQGPSMVIDTACSSSLVSLHTAVMALRNRECDAAVVAGANLVQLPEQHMATMKAGVLSGTSTCHTFDSSADGYARADGIGALFVKRLSDAIRDRDPIRSVIRASAINTLRSASYDTNNCIRNGKTQGISLPSARAQEAVIRKAHAVAGLSLSNTAYVECHGTGTLVGDPIEVEALSRAFADRPKDSPLLIGGIKPSLGHSEAASGISGIIKATLALETGLIPPTIGVKTINPKIKTSEWNIEIVTRNTPFLDNGGPCRIGVNSFGYGGSNAHVVLEAADAFLPADHKKSSISTEVLSLTDKAFLLPFSASNPESLLSRVSGLKADHLNIADLAYTLSKRRSKLPVRGFIIARQGKLAQNLRSEEFQTKIASQNNRTDSPFAFVFTGQGAQWAEMGKGLIEQFPVARLSIQKMDAILQKLPHPPSWKLLAPKDRFQPADSVLLDVLSEPAEDSQMNEVTHSQPACTAIQIAIIDVLAHWGIKPEGIVGHSSGEIAAAYAANCLTAEQAIVIAYYRGYAVGKLPATGQMMAVGLSQEEGTEGIKKAGLEGKLTVACVNSPVSITMSGDSDAADIMMSKLGTTNTFRRKLITGGRAYHSHHVKSVGQQYEDLINNVLDLTHAISPLSESPLFISSVTGEAMTSAANSSYWRANLECPVLFSQALQVLQSGRKFQLIELGPHAALKLPINQIRTRLGITEADLPYYSALYRGEDSSTSLLKLMGQLFLSGSDISFEKINSLQSGERHRDITSAGVMVKDLPTYQWTYDQLLWNESRASLEFRYREYPRHELLGSLIGGGNLTDRLWRNVLHVKDVPWLEDHKLDQQIVFPAAAFIGMAIEAVSQIHGKHLKLHESIELRNVNILAALTLSPNLTSPGIELFTTLRPQALSQTSKSKNWLSFEITSIQDKIPLVHATGLIRRTVSRDVLEKQLKFAGESMEPNAVRNWYGKLIKEGLNFGPEFQSIKKLQVHRGKSLRHAIAEVSHLQAAPGAEKKDDRYYIHPITADAMLQAGIISTAGGLIGSLRGQIPVMIESITVRASAVQGPPEQCFINAKSEPRGAGQTNMFAELYNSEGYVYAQMSGIRMVAYEGAVNNDSFVERHPILRVLWKPDINGLGLPDAETFSSVLADSALSANIGTGTQDVAMLKVLSALDLITHKTPTLRILELGGGQHPDFTQSCLDLLRSTSAFPRHQSFTIGKLIEGGIAVAKPSKAPSSVKVEEWAPYVATDTFDLIILPETENADSTLGIRLDAIARFLSSTGLVLAVSRSTNSDLHTVNDFDIRTSEIDDNSCVVLAGRKANEEHKRSTSIHQAIIVEHTISDLGTTISEALTNLKNTVNVTHITLSEVASSNIPSKSTVILTAETQKNLLSTVTETEMSKLKIITDNAANIVWLTNANFMDCKNPETALVNGFSRALMLEQPSLKFFTLDIDGASSRTTTARHIIDILHQDEFSIDYEFLQRNGVIHVSRFVPDEDLNQKFQQKQGRIVGEAALKDARDARLIIQNIGQFDTLTFKQEIHQEPLPDTYVEIDVKSVGLNAKDIYVLSGKTETINGTCALEYSGVVRSAGSSVNNVAVGDRVVVMAPNDFRLVERAPHWACVKLEDGEDFNTVSTLGVAFSTAIYALHDRAQIQAGETVLIHSGAGGLGIAAIQIAKLAGAEIFVTVGSQAKREYLINTFSLEPSHIFNSRDSSFLDGILAATDGRGVDVVLNSLTGDLLHESWRACAEFGRFVEVGKKDIFDAGHLDMRNFLKNATFTAFDLSGLYYSKSPKVQAIWARLLKETMKLYREGQIQSIQPLKVFDVSEVTDAFRYFSLKDRMGKIAVSFENPESRIKILPFKYETTFSAQKSYLLVGCLGGLGKSIAKWMFDRGARKFVFLGRSGTDRSAARNLVEDLRRTGAQVDVVRGDVANAADVQRAVDSISGVLGGVIQAAMGLSEALWTSMSNSAWHTALGLGMISEVGYLHENPEIEALLLRKGIQAINEDELIQIVDLALSSQGKTDGLGGDLAASSHILTGLEPHGLKELRKKGFEGDHIVLSDPRANLLSSTLSSSAPTTSSSHGSKISNHLEAALETAGSLHEAITALVKQRFSNLILISVEKVELEKRLTAYGMDSMLAAEFRTWVWQLLGEKITLESLILQIEEEIKTKI
ncbi:polyketide synthase protein [Rutstroemia sp. NJR-2017a BBW]|nr:polyketide synthase protein [Rutstroemia sp. NJR-2017a BBW]